MNDSPLTLRVTDALAEELEQLARARGIPKSRLVREALAHYFVAGSAPPDEPPLLARDFAPMWEALPHLTVDEATRFDTDMQQARATLAPPDDPWA